MPTIITAQEKMELIRAASIEYNVCMKLRKQLALQGLYDQANHEKERARLLQNAARKMTEKN